MKTELACLPCFFRQVTRTVRYTGVNADLGTSLFRRAERLIEEVSFDQAPARISTLLHRMIRETTGIDPYRQVKQEYNRIALELLPAVRSMAGRQGEYACRGDLEGAVRAAIAGNSIDFGIYDTVDLDGALQVAFERHLPAGPLERLAAALNSANNILYLCDNAGEIVFDRVLIDVLKAQGKSVTAVVKGIPVINDATWDDAVAADLFASANRVIDNGSDGIGTLLEHCSSEFLDVYRSAELVISKGQANYETLVEEHDPRIFFLFMVKCPVVAAALDRQNGEIVLLDGGRSAVAV